jgi:lipid-A-disaccharide synthase
MRIGIVAGEASGDLLGAEIVRALREFFPEAEFVGVAGTCMKALGVTTLFPLEKLSVMGFSEVLLKARELLSLRKKVKDFFLENPPVVYIGIDSPDFNLSIETALKKTGIKTVHVNSPTIWAWRKNRIFKIKKAVDLMLTLFPFEPKYYEAEHIPVKYIGHPLADMIPLEEEKKENHTKRVIALLPGSRAGEIKYIAPVLLKAAEMLHYRYPEIVFTSPMANLLVKAQFESLWKSLCPQLPLTVTLGQSREVMAKSDYVILASGTATLEAMLLKKPMIVVYKGSPLSYWIVKKLVTIKKVALPNILTEEDCVPELIQAEATPENIVNVLEEYFHHPERITYLQKRFSDVHEQLRCGAANVAAEAIRNVINTIPKEKRI